MASQGTAERLQAAGRIQAILLDIEGTTTPISFVHDCLFPYAAKHLESYLKAHEQVTKQCIELDDRAIGGVDELVAALRDDMKADRKTKALKHVQGLIWRGAYESGEIKGVAYEDAAEALRRWHGRGLKVYIYSSGSVPAQKLLFGFSDHGDLLPLLNGHFDLTTGSKQEASSYASIAKEIAHGDASRVLFLSDNPLEIRASTQAGMRAMIASRPGNAPLSDEAKSYAPIIESFYAVDTML